MNAIRKKNIPPILIGTHFLSPLCVFVFGNSNFYLFFCQDGMKKKLKRKKKNSKLSFPHLVFKLIHSILFDEVLFSLIIPSCFYSRLRWWWCWWSNLRLFLFRIRISKKKPCRLLKIYLYDFDCIASKVVSMHRHTHTYTMKEKQKKMIDHGFFWMH